MRIGRKRNSAHIKLEERAKSSIRVGGFGSPKRIGGKSREVIDGPGGHRGNQAGSEGSAAAAKGKAVKVHHSTTPSHKAGGKRGLFVVGKKKGVQAEKKIRNRGGTQGDFAFKGKPVVTAVSA